MSSGSASPDLNRDPCPDRILEDVGIGFGMGAVGGSVYHFTRGALVDSPRGHRLAGGATAVRMNAARVGGGFAVWGGLFSAFDCAMVYARQKEDPWNSIAAGAAAGGTLSLRRGLRATGRAAAVGAALLTLFEGAGIVVNRAVALAPPPPLDGLPQAPPVATQDGLPVPDSSTGLLGRKQRDDKVAAKSEVLELDLPSTAVPSFDYK